MTMTWRTTDLAKWGPGKESRVSKVEIDEGNWHLLTRIINLEQNPAQPANISNITLTGSQLSIHLTNGTIFGPFTIPVGVMKFKGNWTAATDYVQLDLVYSAEHGLYLVRLNHTSAATFNPGALGPGGLLYHMIMPSLLGGGTFLGLADTPVTFGTAGQLLAVNSEANGIVFSDPPIGGGGLLSIVEAVGVNVYSASDEDKYFRMISTTASPNGQITIWNEPSFRIGKSVYGRQHSVRKWQIVANDPGTTIINPPRGKTLISAGVGASFKITKVAELVWDVEGDMEAAT